MANPIKVRSTVSSVTPCGAGVYKVAFRPSHKLPFFRPGQFLHLTVDDYDPAGGFWPESRVFSIASRPGKEEIVIVYSVKGAYTRKMESLLSPGAEVWLKLPYGSFIIANQVSAGEDAILVAGGTGISPFIPFLEQCNEAGWFHVPRVYLAYGLRSARQMVFSDVLSDCLQHSDAFRMNLFLEEDDAKVPIARADVSRGPLSINAILAQNPRDRKQVFFLSGPPGMLNVFRSALKDRGFADSEICIDEW
jgi:NAD(P)H-flavin reductase